VDIDISKPMDQVRPHRGAVLLLHGLEGDSQRYYIAELAHTLVKSGYYVVGMNFRGCSGRMNHKRRFYHSGETQDPLFVLRWMRDEWPDLPLFAVGFSLGGNVLAKLLGELGSSNLISAAVPVSVPFDLALGAHSIDQGWNRIYQQRFLVSLRSKLYKKQQRFSDLPNFSGSTFWEFDNQVTAPIHGFTDALDYYKRSSSAAYVSQIQTPTLCIHSKADPICPFDGVPVRDIQSNDWCSAIFTEQGGHVGFGSRPAGWLNRTITHFFNTLTPYQPVS
jgi:predicted alpha/beta-fold hydrolase